MVGYYCYDTHETEQCFNVLQGTYTTGANFFLVPMLIVNHWFSWFAICMVGKSKNVFPLIVWVPRVSWVSSTIFPSENKNSPCIPGHLVIQENLRNKKNWGRHLIFEIISWGPCNCQKLWLSTVFEIYCRKVLPVKST